MAKMQLLGRLGTSLPPLQTFLSVPCSVRIMAPAGCGSAAVSTTGRGEQQVSAGSASASAAAAAASNSSESLCSTGRWVRQPGMSRYRSGAAERASTERAISRGASVLETEAPVVMEPLSVASETTRQRTAFEAEVKAGHVECFSRGCRPVFSSGKEDDSRVFVGEDGVWGGDEALRLLEARAASYTERRTVRDLEICPDVSFPLDFAEFVNDVWKETSTATKYFEIAMKRRPNDANMLMRYAQFAWKTLGDMDMADELFARAVEQSHDDSELQSVYALFLWQVDQ